MSARRAPHDHRHGRKREGQSAPTVENGHRIDPDTGWAFPPVRFDDVTNEQMLYHLERGAGIADNGWGPAARAWEEELPVIRAEILRRMDQKKA